MNTTNAGQKTIADFHVGQRFILGPLVVREKAMLEFSTEFDPAPFHLDKEAAKKSMLGDLAASGWHTCAMLMQMIARDIFGPSGSNGGPGVDMLKWKHPVFAGDTLTGFADVARLRQSNSNKKIGFITFSIILQNQHDKDVLETRFTAIFPTRNNVSSKEND